MPERIFGQLARLSDGWEQVNLRREKHNLDLGPLGDLIPEHGPWKMVETELFKSAAIVLEDLGPDTFACIESMSPEEHAIWLGKFHALAEERGKDQSFAAQEYSEFVLRGLLASQCENKEKQLDELPEGEWDDSLKRYNRFKQTLLVNRRNVIAEADTIDAVVSTRLAGAVNNASDFMWATARIIPTLFKKQFGRMPTPVEFQKTLDKSAGPFIAIAREHGSVLRQLRTRLTHIRPGFKNRFDSFNPEFFQLSGDVEAGTLGLDFTQQAVDGLQKPDSRRIKLGCPALAAAVETAGDSTAPGGDHHKGANFIVKYWQWVKKLANEQYEQSLP